MKKEAEFYQTHLETVSRSFAYCISRLDSPLREWTGLAYLLCRVLDTVEDSPWRSPDLQIQKLKEFRTLFVESQQFKGELNFEWKPQLAAPIPEGEQKLLQETPQLYHFFKSHPEKVRIVLRELLDKMSNGMEKFIGLTRRQRIQNMKELNEYCYYVAGVVGEAMTRLVAIKSNLEPSHAFVSTDSFKKAFHFGLFLQKINILKDQFKDEKEGRYFIFNRQAVLDSLSEHSKCTFEYILSIPNHERGYRIFCATSFFLGLATLPLLQMQTSADIEPKVEREIVLELFHEIEKRADSNEKLEELYQGFAEFKLQS